MSVTTDMERTFNRNLFKHAVQRAIFNSDGSIADIRKSVLVEVNIAGGQHAMTLFSSGDFDRLPSLEETSWHLPAGSIIEVWDGRFLFGHGKSQPGYLKYES